MKYANGREPQMGDKVKRADGAPLVVNVTYAGQFDFEPLAGGALLCATWMVGVDELVAVDPATGEVLPPQ